MPILNGALLCDAAHDYNGLVSILGGFVNIMKTPQLPFAAPIWFAARVGFLSDEIGQPHDVLVRAENPHGEVIAEVRGHLAADVTIPPDADPDLAIAMNMVFPFPILITLEGLHWVELRADETSLVRLPLKVIRLAGT